MRYLFLSLVFLSPCVLAFQNENRTQLHVFKGGEYRSELYATVLAVFTGDADAIKKSRLVRDSTGNLYVDGELLTVELQYPNGSKVPATEQTAFEERLVRQALKNVPLMASHDPDDSFPEKPVPTNNELVERFKSVDVRIAGDLRRYVQVEQEMAGLMEKEPATDSKEQHQLLSALSVLSKTRSEVGVRLVNALKPIVEHPDFEKVLSKDQVEGAKGIYERAKAAIATNKTFQERISRIKTAIDSGANVATPLIGTTDDSDRTVVGQNPRGYKVQSFNPDDPKDRQELMKSNTTAWFRHLLSPLHPSISMPDRWNDVGMFGDSFNRSLLEKNALVRGAQKSMENWTLVYVHQHLMDAAMVPDWGRFPHLRRKLNARLIISEDPDFDNPAWIYGK